MNESFDRTASHMADEYISQIEKKEITLEKNFTLSEDELKIVREAIIKTITDYIANRK